MKNYKKIILDNGIPLYLYNDKSLKQTFFSYIIKYGSDGKWFDFNLNGKDIHVLPGYAHYLEHLLFERSKYGNVLINFKKRSYKSNAYTANDHTCYYFYGVDDIEDSMKQLIEAIECPVFDDKSVDQTRHAIEEEAAMFCDDADYCTMSLVNNNLYKDFKMVDDSLCIIGSRTTTRNITTEDLYNCYNAFYTNDRKILVVAGNVNEEKIISYLNNLYSKIDEHKSNLILPKYNMDGIRKEYESIQGTLNTNDIYGHGIKLKRPQNISMRDFSSAIDILHSHLWGKNFNSKLKDEEILDDIGYCGIENEEDDLIMYQTFAAKNDREYINKINNEISALPITKKEFDSIIKSYIVKEIRKSEDKYYIPSMFGLRMHKTEDYSDIEYFRSLKYDDVMNILKNLDYSNQAEVKMKRLVK